MDKIDRVANKARKSISDFCMNDCKAYCCRKGYLVMTKNQLQEVVGNKQEDYKAQIKELNTNRFSLYLGKSDKPCPSLTSEHKCKVHESKLRPKACHDFPLFLNKKDRKFLLSPRCLAVNLNMFLPYEKKLKSLGLEMMRANSIVGLTGLELPNNFVDKKLSKEKTQKIYKQQ